MPEVSKVPVHSIVLSRDTGKKDPKGEPIYARVSPPIGKPFSFSEEEVQDIMGANPLALRDPKDETELPEKIKQAAEEAMQKTAVQEGSAAAGDAEQVAVTAAKGRKPQKTAGVQSGAETTTDPEDDSDTL